jgi:methylmalonyl-CoA carboxyltransferase large subunit
MSEPTLADVLAAVHALSGQVEVLAARVDSLEAELAAVRAELPPREVPEEVVIAISAAVAAFLGHRARLTQVRYHSGGDAWTQHGRAAVHRREVLLGVR